MASPRLMTVACTLGQVLSSALSSIVAAPMVLHDPRPASPLHHLTPAERAGAGRLITWLHTWDQGARRMSVRYGLTNDQQHDHFSSLELRDVQFTLVAPWRSPRPEQLTLVDLGKREGMQYLVVFGEGAGREVWSLKPTSNFSMCGIRQVYSLRDVDLNGRRELAFVMQCGSHAQRSSSLLMAEFTPSAARVSSLHFQEDRQVWPEGGQVRGGFQMLLNVEKGRTPWYTAQTLRRYGAFYFPALDAYQAPPVGQTIPVQPEPMDVQFLRVK
ncbi:hypothetical protein [Deinococcus sp. QL22]|uniref:hypothetical protein n=1 Tax=Deinococcus sp. QL22 TaxID=2939437 RepID=UPI002017C86F|nr:hypothetical protein [Deinococcus sp. QL22]UQN06468.1 hypothetical protein M1R55_00695 [Deinococcus sp. QL22]